MTFDVFSLNLKQPQNTSLVISDPLDDPLDGDKQILHQMEAR